MLFQAFLFGLLGIGGYVLASSTSGAWSAFGWGSAALGSSLCTVGVVKVLWEAHADYIERVAAARTNTPESTLADKLHNLDIDKVSIVRGVGEVALGLKPDFTGPRFYINGTKIPIEFIRDEFLPHCTMDVKGVTSTAKISDWSDGKMYAGEQCRTLAREFIQYLVDQRLAIWWAGNQSAKMKMNAFELRTMLGMREDLE